jgi:hypothetical protein
MRCISSAQKSLQSGVFSGILRRSRRKNRSIQVIGLSGECEGALTFTRPKDEVAVISEEVTATSGCRLISRYFFIID